MYKFEDCIIKENVDMKSCTSFKTGGVARIMIEPKTPGAVAKVIRALKERGEEYYVLGNGTNLLVSDEGIDKPIIHIGKEMSDVTVEGKLITSSAGAILAKVANSAYKESLTGMEFAHGIPGSIGGAVCMNAGAYGGEIGDIVDWIEYASPNGELYRMDGNTAQFSYRRSFFSDKDFIVTRVCLKLEEGNGEEIIGKMKKLSEKRRSKQPLEYPSAGSAFKRPEGYFAAALIEEAGLKGEMVGGAQVSEKHSGFIINKDNATTKDVVDLMEKVKKVVFDKYGVKLESEIKLWE